ncbi:MAG: FG-GAP-like repeat-containing protein, partial [Verrucomicrobiia bacterium]
RQSPIQDDRPVILDGALSLTENQLLNASIGMVPASDEDVGQQLAWSIGSGNLGGAFRIDRRTGELFVAEPAAVDFESAPIVNLAITVIDNGASGVDLGGDANLSSAIALGDLDGDGDLDLVEGNSGQHSINRVSLNLGAVVGVPAFESSDLSGDGAATASLALGDVDGDGDLDVVVGNSAFQRNRLHLNNGTTAPFAGVAGADASNDADDTRALALADFDGDGDLDLIAGNLGANRMYLNDGSELPFQAGGLAIGVFHRATVSLAAADMDGDGDLDLVEGNLGQANRLFLNNGGPNPFFGVVGSDISSEANLTYTVALGDVDGDGDVDMAEGNLFAVNRLYLNNGGRAPFQGVFAVDLTVDSDSTGTLALGDLDGDGDLDLIEGNSGAQNRLYLNGGEANPFASSVGVPLTGEENLTRSLQLGDLDGDGDPDVVEGNNLERNRGFLMDLLSASAEVVISISDENEAPLMPDISLGVPENSAAGVRVGAVRAIDSDVGDVIGYVIAAGNGGGEFLIDSNSGEITVAAGADLDFERRVRYDLTVVASDSAQPPLTDSARVMIFLQNQNDPPILVAPLPDQTGTQGETHRFDVDGFFVEQDGDSIVYAASGLPSSLSVDVRTGVISGTPVNADFLNSPFSVTVTAADSLGGATEASYEMSVSNLNDPPRLIQPIGRQNAFHDVEFVFGAGARFEDIDGDALLFAALGLPVSLSIDPASGVISGTLTQTEFQNSPFTVIATATDPANETASDAFTLTVLSLDSSPQIRTRMFRVQEDTAAGVVVGRVDAIVPKEGQTLAFELLSGAGEPHFSIDGGTGDVTVRDSAGLDFEAAPLLPLEVKVSNLTAGGVFATQTIVVELTDGNEPPRVADQTMSVFGGSQNAASVGFVTAIDVDAGSSLSFAIVSSSPADAFAIDSRTGEITIADNSRLNPTAMPTASVIVEVTDEGVIGSELTADNDLPLDIAVGDIDGDGWRDLIVGNGNQPGRVYLNTGGIDPFGETVGFDFTMESKLTSGVAVGDLNGDGFPDIVAANQLAQNRVYLNSGASPFFGAGPASFSSDFQNSFTAVLGDLDRDGDLDVVVGNGGANLRLYMNDGDGDPFDGVVGVNVTSDVRQIESLALGDVDNDGDLDLVAGASLGANRLYLNNGGAASFAGVSGLDITTDAHTTRAIALADMNGDGRLDVIVGNAGQPNRLYLNNGTANPFGGVSGADISPDIASTRSVAAADFDGDGDLDVLMGNNNTLNRLYINNGTSTPFAGVEGINFSDDLEFTRRVQTVDLDGDGDQDVIVANSTAVNRYYMNRGIVRLATRGVVTIQLLAPNVAPTLNNQSFVVAENSPAGTVVGPILASDSDAGQTLSFDIVGGNDSGHFVLGSLDGVLKAAPGSALDFGTAPLHNLSVRVTDDSPGNRLSVTGLVSVIVTDVNDRPTLNPINSPDPINEDSGLQTVTLFGIGSGEAQEQQTLTVNAVTDNPGLLPQLQIDYTSPNTVSFVTYASAPDRFGVANVMVTVDDGGGANSQIQRVFTVRVNPLNDAPMALIAQPADGAVLKGGSPIEIAVLADDLDGEVTRVEFFVNQFKLGESLAPPHTIVWQGSQLGDYTLTARAIDNQFGFRVTQPVEIHVHPAIHAPRVRLNGDFEMNFIGMPGVNYELQHSADLNVWSPVNPPLILTGVGAQTPVVDRTSGGAAHRYYRFVPLAP